MSGPVPQARGPLVVLASGVSWDDAWMSEKHLAVALSAYVPVLFVDPPVSYLTPLRKPHLRAGGLRPRVAQARPGLTRVTPLAPPGVSRPGLRVAAAAATRHAIRDAVRRTGGDVHALVAASLDDVLGACPDALRVLWGTDDWVAGADLMGLSADYLRRREDAQLAAADLVVTVTGHLADLWRDRCAQVAVVPNGCDPAHFAHVDEATPAADVHLPGPVAGFVGHLSDRIDVSVLEAVADTGVSLLLVGPVQPGFATDRLARLLARENVQATGRRPFEDLPGYLRVIDVGLTPYADTAFNRSSFPLKTLEYLAAGRAVVTTGLPAARELPADLVTLADGPAQMAAATVAALAAQADPALADRRRAYAHGQSWDARARAFLDVLGLGDHALAVPATET
ncbi:glycosyltransferase [Cellulomonas soli]|uniref:glycosyltransferase n=1 Tax=Cellulomonas soli TaxID=931535 RepID=UPI003F83085A